MPDPTPDPDAVARPPAPAARVSLSERVQQWRSDPRVAAAVVVVVVLAAAAVWVRSTAAGSSPPGPSPISAAPAAAAPSTTAKAGPMVHVVGAVRASGVVQLPPGARVRDAVAAAGGAADDADLERLNLAAPVTDGQRIAVPRLGDPAPPAPAGDPSAAGSGRSGAPVGPIDLNTATASDLETLPGIGPTLADAIVREREKRGGFKSVDDLKQVRGIGEARFAEIRDLVTL
jgi:competence protein ComEA